MTIASELPSPALNTSRRKLSAWSATPTPFDETGAIDTASLCRSLAHHSLLGCEGVMLAGTCGEGPWLSRADIEKLVRTGLEHAGNTLEIAVQVTDNSPRLILERLETLASWGVQKGIVAQPYFFMNSTPKRLQSFYQEVFDRSPIPLFFYDRGKAAAVPVPIEILHDTLVHPRVVGIKDSAGQEDRFAIMSGVRKLRPELRILAGNEFQLIESLRAGYDGAFFGGMIIIGLAVRRCFALYQNDQQEAAEALNDEIKHVLFDIYGGPAITCWLSGLKYALVRLGIYTNWSNIPDYPLTADCREAIDKAVDRIDWIRP